MMIDVVATPRDIRPDHAGAIFVVIDVMRATTSMVTALSNGARMFVPVTDYDAARALKTGPDILLCGEEMGKPLPDFDLSNSPREYQPDVVQDKILVQCTSNGTKAIAACAAASEVIAAAFINMQAVCAYLRHVKTDIVCVCSGERGKLSLEDFLCAGNIVDNLAVRASDPACAARLAYQSCRDTLYETMRDSEWGSYIASIGYADDIQYCAQLNSVDIVPKIQFNPCNSPYSIVATTHIR